MTEVVHVDPEAPDPGAVRRAADCLRSGGLVAFPTETVYGLGVHALDRAAVRRLFAAKQRPAIDPLIVHVGSAEGIEPLVASVPDQVRVLADRFWPGPLTLVLPRSPAVPDEVTAGLATVAVRVPSQPVARAIIASARIPIAAPSANLFSRPSPTCAAHVLEDLGGRIDLIVDGGPTAIGVESTVLDLTRDPPTVLRPGAISLGMLRQVLPAVESAAAPRDAARAMPSPGMLDKHYAPRAALTLFEGDGRSLPDALIAAAHSALAAGKAVGIVAADEDRPVLDSIDPARGRLVVRTLGPGSDVDLVAARLYAALRELDASGVDVILARGFPSDEGLGPAVRDRLRRAAAGKIVPG